MGMDIGLAELMKQAKEIRDAIGTADDLRQQRLDAVEKSINELYLRTNRPGPDRGGVADIERKSAVEFCVLKHELDVPKADGQAPYTPSSAEVENAANTGDPNGPGSRPVR